MQRRADAEERWIKSHEALIAALKEAGHSPWIRTEQHKDFEGDISYITKMGCTRCRERYRGMLIHRWKGLSPKRPCK